MTTTYKVYRRIPPGAQSVVASGLTSPFYLDTGLTNDTEYEYQVSAVNEAGEGPKSSAVLVTPVASGGAITPSAPIEVTTSGQTIEDKSFAGTLGVGYAIYAHGTQASPLTSLTIRNCTIHGFNVGINLSFVNNITIEDCVIEDVEYAGILTFSVVHGVIQRNQIRRIGYARTDLNQSIENNAYGIALSRLAPNDNLTTNPRTEDILVDDNVIEDVPLWHGLDTHGGKDITFSNNIVRRCPRAIFLTGGTVVHPVNIAVTDNQILEAVQKTGGTNKTAVTLVNMQGGSITGNDFSSTYGTPFVYDYLGNNPAGSTGVTVSGNNTVA